MLTPTGDQPICTISPGQNWELLDGLTLVDPEYNKSGRIDILLGVGIIRHGRRVGITPTALNTDFGLVVAGNTGPLANTQFASSYLTSVMTGYDLLHRFWEVEEKTVANCTLSVEEQ